MGSKKKQVGIIPYLINKSGKIKYVLVTPKYSKNYWIFPKGNIEKKLGPQKSAAEEAYEEAGLKGIIKSKLKIQYRYEKFATEYKVDLYLMKVKEVLESWDEQDERKRFIATPEQVEEMITDKSILKAFRKAHKIVSKSKK